MSDALPRGTAFQMRGLKVQSLFSIPALAIVLGSLTALVDLTSAQWEWLLGAALLCTPVTGHAGPPFEARSIDGTGNNLDNPTWGSADTPLLRLGTAAYSDDVSAPAGLDRPSSRMVSNALSAMAGPTP